MWAQRWTMFLSAFLWCLEYLFTRDFIVRFVLLACCSFVLIRCVQPKYELSPFLEDWLV